MGLPKERRLRRRQEFLKVLRDGYRVRDHLLSITAIDSGNPEAKSRYGFAVPKRVGNAVIRNRIKRRLREIVRNSDHPRGWEYVIYAFPAASNATFKQLSGSVDKLVNRLKTGRRVRRPNKRTG